MGFGVQCLIDWLKTNESSLSSFHHCEPDNEEPKDEERCNGVGFGRYLRLASEDGSHDNDDRENQQGRRVQVLDSSDSNVDVLVSLSDWHRRVSGETLKVNIVWLVSYDELVETTKNPGSRTNSRVIKNQANTDDEVDERVGQEGKRKG